MSGQMISRLDGELSNEGALKILDLHRNQNFAQAHLERLAHLVGLARQCRKALGGMLLSVGIKSRGYRFGPDSPAGANER